MGHKRVYVGCGIRRNCLSVRIIIVLYNQWTDGPFVGQTTQSATADIVGGEAQATRRQVAEAIMRPGCWGSKFYWTVTFSLLTPFMYRAGDDFIATRISPEIPLFLIKTPLRPSAGLFVCQPKPFTVAMDQPASQKFVREQCPLCWPSRTGPRCNSPETIHVYLAWPMPQQWCCKSNKRQQSICTTESDGVSLQATFYCPWEGGACWKSINAIVD